MSAEVTLVISPREVWSYAKGSLDNLYETAGYPFSLVYIDGGSPTYLQRHLEKESQRRGFELIREDRFLTPNEARNMGFARVTTPYVCFVDNDIYGEEGWLAKLVGTAEKTNAAIVGPTYCEGHPDKKKIHMAGGYAHIETRGNQRYLHEGHHHRKLTLPQVRHELRCEPTELVETHTMLVRSDVLRDFGGFDEGMPSVNEHVDLCLLVREKGMEVYFEPSSIVTYRARTLLWPSDYPFFWSRWSDAHNAASLKHFQHKHGIADDDQGLQKEYWGATRLRRRPLRPFSRPAQWLFGRKAAVPIEAFLDRCVTKLLSWRSPAVKEEVPPLAGDAEDPGWMTPDIRYQ